MRIEAIWLAAALALVPCSMAGGRPAKVQVRPKLCAVEWAATAKGFQNRFGSQAKFQERCEKATWVARCINGAIFLGDDHSYDACVGDGGVKYFVDPPDA